MKSGRCRSLGEVANVMLSLRHKKAPVASQQQYGLFSCHLWHALTIARHTHLLIEETFLP